MPKSQAYRESRKSQISRGSGARVKGRKGKKGAAGSGKRIGGARRGIKSGTPKGAGKRTSQTPRSGTPSGTGKRIKR